MSVRIDLAIKMCTYYILHRVSQHLTLCVRNTTMYRPSGSAPKRVEEPDGEEYDSMDEELLGEEEQDVVTTMEDGNNTVAGDYESAANKHIDTQTLENFSQLFIDVDVDASPDQMASNLKLAEVHFKEELHRHFQENLSDKDRNNAGEDNLHGNVRTIVPLGLEVVEHQNTLPYKMEVVSNKHFLGKAVHKAGNAIWTVYPGTQPTPVGRMVFAPANVFTERMYHKAKMCTMADIDDDIKMTSATKQRAGFATVATGTAAHDRLKKGLDKGEWAKVRISDEEWNEIFDPPRRARTINVPLPLGEALKADLRSDLQSVMDRTINIEDFTFTLRRSDGLKFNAPQNMHGMLVGNGLDNGEANGDGMTERMMATSARAAVRFLFTFRAI